MALSIKSERADKLARELAELTGESITEAVLQSLETRLARERRRRSNRELAHIIERFGALPVLDDRPPDAILGYDEHGLTT